MSAKKWSISSVIAVVLTLVLFASSMRWMDPLVQYGKESPPLTSYEYTEMYSNPGIAKNYDYDSVMVGTSMIESTDVDLCDKLFDCNMIRMPYSGGTTYNMKTILDLCFESNDNIKSVYWELDEFQLTGSPTEPRYPLPEYLYKTDHSEDISYLLNLDIFYHYAVIDIFNTLRGNIQNAERRGITLTGDFGKDSMLAAYNRPEISETKVDFKKSTMRSKEDQNLKNIEGLVVNNKDTQFTFFFPPFSVIYWDNDIRKGQFDATMDSVEYAMSKLLKYDNVRIYFYQGEESIITNLDNYKDFSHYGNWINDAITEKIANNENEITLDNYKNEVENMRNFIKNFDYESLFAGQ